MTSDKKRSRKSTHRATLHAFISAGQHLIDEHHAKSIEQIAVETGMPSSTVRHWLTRDHWDVCCRWWPMSAPMFQELRRQIKSLRRDLAQEQIAVAADRR